MTALSQAPATSVPSPVRLKLALVILLHIAALCLTFVYVTQYYALYGIFRFDANRLLPALLNVAPLVLASFVFVIARFSFGYVIGFYLYTMALGYLWLAKFSLLAYDHTLASLSTMLSVAAFLLPALFITAPLKQWIVLPERTFDHLLSLILVGAAGIVAVGVVYNFRLVNVIDIYDFRSQVDLPGPLRYAIGIFTNALLPFAFAFALIRNKRWRAAASLLLLLSFYPITLSKAALFGPPWLLFLALLAGLFEARIAVVLSLLLAMALGLVFVQFEKLGALSDGHLRYYFGIVNLRMIAMPSIAYDLYNDFFARHELTYFCQIGVLKRFMSCPYSEWLVIVMSKAYPFGFLNASLFATEGIASLGVKLAPLSIFVCGLIIALSNRLSAGLPARFILVSGGMLVRVLVDVPLATTLLSFGGACLFLLWYLTPRELFQSDAAGTDIAARPS
jgi:hypothetical protein